jgi:hypothetical protein
MSNGFVLFITLKRLYQDKTLPFPSFGGVAKIQRIFDGVVFKIVNGEFFTIGSQRLTIHSPSPDCNGILFGGGRSKAEPVAKKIQWKAGKSFKKRKKVERWKLSIIENKVY